MEAVKILSVTVGLSLGIAFVFTVIVSSGLDAMERARLRWVGRANAHKMSHAG